MGTLLNLNPPRRGTSEGSPGPDAGGDLEESAGLGPSSPGTINVVDPSTFAAGSSLRAGLSIFGASAAGGSPSGATPFGATPFGGALSALTGGLNAIAGNPQGAPTGTSLAGGPALSGNSAFGGIGDLLMPGNMSPSMKSLFQFAVAAPVITALMWPRERSGMGLYASLLIGGSILSSMANAATRGEQGENA